MIRLRISYKKLAALQYTGILDMQKVWERTFRRAQLPLAYSQGFHPQPRLQLACPLPLGFLSLVEVLDVWLEVEAPLPEHEHHLQATLPPGLEITAIESIPLNAPTFQSHVVFTIYDVALLDAIDAAALHKSVSDLLNSPSLMRIRRGKSYDLKPLIGSIELHPSAGDQPARLVMRLAAQEGRTGRPDEVLLQLGIDPSAAIITRTGWMLAESSVPDER